MIRAGTWLILFIYFAFLLIYMNGNTGADDYFWVNNDFFVTELLITAAVITVVVLINSYGTFKSQPQGSRSLAAFKGFFVCLGLTALFVPFAFAVALIDYGFGT